MKLVLSLSSKSKQMEKLTREQKDEILSWSNNMMDGQVKILSSYRVIAAIDPTFAVQALSKIIQTLQKPLDKTAALDDLNANWNMGLIDKDFYEKSLAYIEKQYL